MTLPCDCEKKRNFLYRLFSDPAGTPSARRVMGCFLIIFGCGLAPFRYNLELVLGLVGMGIGLLGVTAFDKKKEPHE